MGALVLPKDNAMSLTAYADADQCGNVRILRRNASATGRYLTNALPRERVWNFLLITTWDEELTLEPSNAFKIGED
ncbi:hypothetical protein Tco_1243497 [Tanacetum coccineum]